MDIHGMDSNRREFLIAASAGLASAGIVGIAGQSAGQEPRPVGIVRPVLVCSANGLKWLDKAMELLRRGGNPLDAVLSVATAVEDDPSDQSVGLGGLPNEEGVVELDASVMHGPTHKAGAVASLRNIRNPAHVARLVMERTDHVLLVGEGALRFARAHGFKEENLLTEESRRKWLRWKESLSDKDDWLEGPAEHKRGARGPEADDRIWGTVHCCGVSAAGDVAAVTSTSGLAYKIPGRVGDSPIIGAGIYADNSVGAAGSTGRGEANLQNCTSFFVVELMRQGRGPQEACLEAIKRVAERTESRLRDSQGQPSFDLQVYALSKDGRHGGASMWAGPKYAVHDGTSARHLPCEGLYRKA